LISLVRGFRKSRTSRAEIVILFGIIVTALALDASNREKAQRRGLKTVSPATTTNKPKTPHRHELYKFPFTKKTRLDKQTQTTKARQKLRSHEWSKALDSAPAAAKLKIENDRKNQARESNKSSD
jgi:hypothetical protein